MNSIFRVRAQVLALVFVLAASAASMTSAEVRFITLASTTSTEQSGLFRHLLPAFERTTGITVRVVALGTGQALDIGRRCDADVLLVHDKTAEERFVAEGFGTRRADVMYNDFVLIGPKADPAGAAGRDIVTGFRRIAAAKPPFVSRGDRSGTHAAELRYWLEAGIDIAAARGLWYKDTGSGMGQALNIASSINGYVLADRSTWLSFSNRGDLGVLVEGDRRLFNQYGVIPVSPDKCSAVKQGLGTQFADWLVSSDGQQAIAGYKIGNEQLFFPNAAR